MILLPVDTVRLGDTLRLTWNLPAGARLLRGPRLDDSLAVAADTARPGSWLLQPLAVGFRGGDTLLALSGTGDTLRETVPEWRAMPALGPADTATASLLPPRDVPVPFPWREAALGGLVLAVVLAGLWWWHRRRTRRPPPPPPPVAAIPAHDRVLEALRVLEERSRAGAPARETAFQVGLLLRELHREVLDWPDATDSTSSEWKTILSSRCPEALDAVRWFLEEADPIRYADDLRDPGELFPRARAVLDATPPKEA